MGIGKGNRTFARGGGRASIGCAWLVALILVPAVACVAADKPKADEKGWISLFDGKSLKGWKVSKDSPKSFSVRDGILVVDGPRAHLFYDGPVKNHNFKNFELKLKAKTNPKANSGVYIHTKYQEKGWPKIGYECQVNSSHGDWRRTGSLYGVKDIKEAHSKDGVWFDYHITVKGKRIVLKVNGKTTVDYTEPDNIKPGTGRRLSSGTFAIQGHDPGSHIEYKDIKVKPLPD